MQIIFDWCESFNENKTKWRGDEELLSLEILHKESSFAIAKANIYAKHQKDLFSKKFAKIGIKNNDGNIEVLFSGRVMSFPTALKNSAIGIELIAEPDNYQKQLNNFVKHNIQLYRDGDLHNLQEKTLNFDELFYSEKDAKNPTVFLEGGSKIFYWDRGNGELSLSDISQGRKNITISCNDILQDSMKIKFSRNPYKSINLQISASWIQHVSGIIDIMPMIAQKFQNNIVNSFTNIKSSFYKIKTPSRGYALLHCDITEINPNDRGILSNHPVASPKFNVNSTDGVEQISACFQRFYFKGKLVFLWGYKQKRIETVSVKISNAGTQRGREKNVVLKLNAIQLPKKYPDWNFFKYYSRGDCVILEENVFECAESHVSGDFFDKEKWKLMRKIPDALRDNEASSFFATDRGKNAIRYAMQKVAALMNYSDRYLEVTFCVAASDFYQITLDDQITIFDRHFPNGKICGKVIKTYFTGKCDSKIVQITIACCENDLHLHRFEKVKNHKIEIQVDDNKVQPADIVTNLEVINSPEEQLQILSQSNVKTIAELKNILRKHMTKIKLTMHPLSTMRFITSELTLAQMII